MLLLANLTKCYKIMQKNPKITGTLAHEYSSVSAKRELSYKYQHDRDKMVLKNLCILVLWKNVASALGLILQLLPSTLSHTLLKNLHLNLQLFLIFIDYKPLLKTNLSGFSTVYDALFINRVPLA